MLTPALHRAPTRMCALTLLGASMLAWPVLSTAQGSTAQGSTAQFIAIEEQAAARAAAIEAKRAATRPIAAGQSLWLEQLTSLEIRDLIATGTHTVIIPTGGVEENGPFLSTGKHNVILEASCPAVAAALGNALCAPIVKFVPEGSIDPPSGHMHFHGTISLSDATYEALLTDIARSLRQSGFKHIVMIGDSGGNQTGMARVAERLNEQWAQTSTRAHFIRDFYNPGWQEVEAYTERELGVAQTADDGHHDDIWVTAMMMVTDPVQVRYEQRVAVGLASINGVSIEPADRTAELGLQMIAFRAALTADAIRAAIGTGAQRE